MDFFQTLFGALVGGLLAILGSYIAATRAAQASAQLAATERVQLHRQQQTSDIAAILAEMRAAVRLAADHGTLHSNNLPPFSSEIWGQNKGSLGALKTEIEETIQNGYVELSIASSLSVNNLRLSWGAGYLNNSYRQRVESMVGYFEAAIPSLEKWLRQPSFPSRPSPV